MEIRVERVIIPLGSTVGFGFGHPLGDETVRFVFAGDADPMFDLAVAIASVGPVVADVPEWAIVDRLELPGD